MVYGSGLENRRARKCTVGSNPTLSVGVLGPGYWVLSVGHRVSDWGGGAPAGGDCMTSNSSHTARDEKVVVEAVRRLIQERHPGGVTLEVLPHGVRQDEGWWYVPVRPSSEPARRYEYYETLAEVENELQKSDRLTVLLVPSPPEE